MNGIVDLRPGGRVMSLHRETRVLPIAEATTKLWRNGGGRTTPIHAHLPQSSEDPLWTLSLARLEHAAPFSTFAGYDRYFMVAGSVPVELDIDGRRRSLAYTDVARFTGEARVSVRFDGAVGTALNLMTKRSDYLGDLTFRRCDGDRIVDPRRVTALVLLSGELDVSGTALHALGDTVLIGDRPIIVTGTSATVARVRVTRLDDEPDMHSESLLFDERFLR
ncbi:HutD family protein [Rhodococcus sp. G-MC3]|uniref:HutD/Ves family protein n=1 Tax=Rhodococcus sp. G-MC3 TaxID=3046209 RepID=UPI0024BA531E|nr:HutD family protein [Rhodococcus sp. G-MC3]MDJ0396452.1 HutD family protein [Rhodococcus sp. G-MC3]